MDFHGRFSQQNSSEQAGTNGMQAIRRGIAAESGEKTPGNLNSGRRGGLTRPSRMIQKDGEMFSAV